MIEINGLTQDQVDMLDHMWSLDSEQEYLEWYDLLDEKDQEMADVLMKMVILAELDNIADEASERATQELLKKFVLH